MRKIADRDRIQRFMRALGAQTHEDTRVYLTDGATVVLYGWRGSTIDVDIKIVPDRDHLLRAVPPIKEDLHINVELASPLDFIPVPDGWEDRSPSIRQEGRAFFHHFDLYAQALAKIERGHAQDLDDVTRCCVEASSTASKDVNTLPRSSPSSTVTHPSIPEPFTRL